MNTMLEYSEIDSPIHKLTGATKLIFMITWVLASMITYDTRVLVFMLAFSFIIFKLSKVNFKDIAFVVYFILVFLIINNIAIFVFSPFEGVNIYGTKTEIFSISSHYVVTLEQLFYQINISLKYFSIIPVALLFIVATNPSEFASSLNKIGVSYKLGYSVSLALRYIPDVQRDYQDISFAQQARGIDMSKKEKLFKRIQNSAAIIMPLIFSSLDRIESISCAMELRAFGRKKTRTWYSERDFKRVDYIAITLGILVFLLALSMTLLNGGRYYNPFIN